MSTFLQHTVQIGARVQWLAIDGKEFSGTVLKIYASDHQQHDNMAMLIRRDGSLDAEMKLFSELKTVNEENN